MKSFTSTIQYWLDSITFEDFLLGKTAKAEYYDYITYDAFLVAGDEITYDAIENLKRNNLLKIEVILQLKAFADIEFSGIPT